MKRMRNKIWILVAALLLLIPVCRWIVLPQLERMPDNFSYSANIFSVDNLYDETEQRFSGEVLSVTKFSYDVVKKENDGDLIIKNIFDVRKLSGEKIFSVERLYGIDPSTGVHIHGKGDRDREGYLFAPKNISNKEDFTYWHINYNVPARMKFQDEEVIAGLKVYRYACSYKADQTENLTFLPGVPKERGVELDIFLQTWIDPVTGSLIKYEDNTTAWYYDIHTHKRLHPWNKFHNEFAESSILKQVQDAKNTRQTIDWAKVYLPVAFFLLALLVVLITSFKPKYNRRFIPAFVALLIVTVGAGTCSLFYFSQRTAQHQKQLEQFELDANKALSQFKSELDFSKLTLDILRVDYMHSDGIERKIFAELSKYLLKKS